MLGFFKHFATRHMAQEREKNEKAKAPGAPGPELRLLDRRAFVGFPPLELAPGLKILDFALQIPDVSFPFNMTGGASRYQRKTLQFGLLELAVSAELVTRRVAEVAAELNDLAELKLHFRAGYLEGQARLTSGDRTPLTFKLAFDGDGERLAVYIYDVRLYGFSATPAAQIPVILSRAVQGLELLPQVELRGASGFSARVLPALTQVAAVSRGFKVPVLDQARLSAAEVSSNGLTLRFSAGGLPPPANFDEELLFALEGARAFADAEALIAQGKLSEAREAYLKLGDAHEAHPFAAERLLSLMAADPQAHELVLDLCASVARRRDRSPAALWAEAVVRERRGEHARAAERFLALCALARKGSEEASAFFAAESAARAARDHAPQMAVRALHELLGLKPDHLPSLRALARAADQANDRAGAVRAYRRLAALARDPAEAADAHVHMARLSALTEDDVAGARLHCEAALRLSPDHPEALYLLGDLCHRSGEHLRALKSLDRLREVAMARHEIDRVGRANLLAGRVWEDGLNQPENALLRYREAVALLPGEAEPLFRMAKMAEAAGKLQEALSGYQQAVELAGPAPRNDEVRTSAHASLHALARLTRTRLADPVRARGYLEAALALDPKDTAALDELIPSFRAQGRAAELADACEKAAQVTDDPKRRAAYWAEAGELFRGRLSNLEKAERLLSAALEADPHHRGALEGMLAIAEGRRDGGLLVRCLRALSELSADARERARLLRRLSVASRDLAFDLDTATWALTEVLRLEPDDLAALGELCGLQRRRADMNGLASALEQRARVAEAQGDKRLSTAALRELAQVLELRLGRVGEALIALEKAARLSPDGAVLLDLADLSLRCERPEAARKALTELLAQLPRSTAPERMAEIRARLGKACDLLGDRDGAIEQYALALPLRKLDDALAERLEQLYADAGNEEALSQLWSVRAEALLGAGRASTAAPLFQKSAQVLKDHGDSDGALQQLSRALEAVPDGAIASEVLASMAELESARGRPEKAAERIAQRAKLSSDPLESAALYAQAAAQVQDTDAELPYLTEAITLDPTLVAPRIRRALRTLEADPRSALADLEGALSVPVTQAGAPDRELRIALTRKAATAALRAGLEPTARRQLAAYVAQRPEDLDAQLELASLHRRANARESLADLLGELWPRLTGKARLEALRELAELSISLSRPAAATDALRELRSAQPDDPWSAQQLLSLLPSAEGDSSVEREERLALLGVVIARASGNDRAQLLIERSRVYERDGKLTLAREDLLAASELASRPEELFHAAATLARNEKDELAELSLWQRALRRVPSLGATIAPRLLELGHARIAAGDLAGARAAFGLVAELTADPARSDVFAARSEASPDSVRADRARADRARVDGIRAEALGGLAEAALKSGDVTAAIEALAAAGTLGSARKRFEVLVRAAALSEAQGDLDRASELLDRALQLAPRHPKAMAQLDRVLTAQKRWDALAELLSSEALTASKADAAPLYARLARLYRDELDRPGPAEAALRRVVQLDARNVEARRELAELLASRDELTEAAELWKQAAALLPAREAAELLFDAMGSCADAGEVELSIALGRYGRTLGEPGAAHLAMFAELLYRSGSRTEALPLAQAWASRVRFEADPDDAARALQVLADLAAESGDLVTAERALRKWMEAEPQAWAPVERLVQLWGTQKPRESVALEWGFLRSLHPSSSVSRRLTALSTRAHRELADVELASQMLEHAAGMSADSLPVRLALCELYRAAGRSGALLAELSQVAQLCEARGEDVLALEALEEVADLAERSGHLDQALETLLRQRELLEKRDEAMWAARVERRRAKLLEEGKLDLGAALASLEASFALSNELYTAREGVRLSVRREDASAEVRWREREVALSTRTDDKVEALLGLARAQLESLGNSAAAEQSIRAALELAPESTAAESALVALLERDGRMAELASFYEDAALREQVPARRGALYLKAADLYQHRAGRPDAAAAAVIAARSAFPDDLSLTERAADLLHQAGRAAEAAEFDAVLLEHDPFRARVFERHVRALTDDKDHAALAALYLRRAERQSGAEAADSYLRAAEQFRASNGSEQALLCEDQAFAAAPENDTAFEAVRSRVEGEVRKLSDVLAQRAQAVPRAETIALLRDRADRLMNAGEALLAADAFDELLAVAGEDLSALTARAELASAFGGPLAAQPYDRRLLRAGGESLAIPVRLKAQLRLGHAALGSGALRDAADAFDAVVALDPDGDKGREALSLLSEIHAKTGDSRGLFQTSLLLAQRAEGAEADALLRRAASLFEEPKDALEALVPLAHRHPTDGRIVDRAAAGLRAAGRHGDLLELYEHSAQALGGARAAELLLQAAKVAAEELSDSDRSRELTERAAELDPRNLPALRALVDGRRAAGGMALVSALSSLAAAVNDADEAARLRLELAQVARTAGELTRAREALEALVVAGPNAPRYGEALDALESLYRAEDDRSGVGRVLSAKAEQVQGEARAKLLAEAASAHVVAAELPVALKLAKSAAKAHPTVDAHLLVASIAGKLEDAAARAEALEKAAALAEGESGAKLLLEAAAARTAAGQKDAAVALYDALVERGAAGLTPQALAIRYEELGRADRALKHGFAPAMAAGDLDRALALADAAKDNARIAEVLWSQLRQGELTTLAWLEALTTDAAGRLELARTLEPLARAEAVERYLKLVRGSDESSRRTAFERLLELGEAEPAVEAALDVLSVSDDALIDAVVAATRTLDPGVRSHFVELLAEALPARRGAMYGERYELARSLEQSAPSEAVEKYAELLSADDPQVRSSAFARLVALGQAERAIAAVVATLQQASAGFVDAVIAAVGKVAAERRLAVLQRLWEVLPERRPALLRERLEVARALESSALEESVAELQRLLVAGDVAVRGEAFARLTALERVERAVEAVLPELASAEDAFVSELIAATRTASSAVRARLIDALAGALPAKASVLVGERLHLASELETNAPKDAQGIYESLLSGADLQVRSSAFARLVGMGEAAHAIRAVLPQLSSAEPAWISEVFAAVRTIAPKSRAEIIGALVEAIPDQAAVLLGERLELARALESTDRAEAVAHHLSLVEVDDAEVRLAAFERLVALGKAESAVRAVLPGLERAGDALADAVLAAVRTLEVSERSRLLDSLAQALPTRRPALFRERFELDRDAGRLDDARKAHARLRAMVEALTERSRLYLELGQMELAAGDLGAAQDAFERALCDDLQALPAVTALLDLADRRGEPELFVAMLDRLEHLEGEAAAAPYQEKAVDALLQLGRKVDAYRILAKLPETPARLQARAGLATELGFIGESLQLRERFTEDVHELERILFGYLGADLLPFAVRLCERLLAMGPVAESTRHLVAERLSPTREGAALAARLWPELLRRDPTDPDGWTLFAEALRLCGRTAEAEQMDGFGAALAGTTLASPGATLQPLSRESEQFKLGAPASMRPLTAETLPRLHAALRGSLKALGAGELSLSLDVEGGVEAYLLSPTELVLGAGALAVFGPVELGYLLALALALGSRGGRLRGISEVEGFAEAAAKAYAASPASLAAARVLAQLEPSIRGGDPLTVDVPSVLKQSDAFRAITAEALSQTDKKA